jgi:hypothetical protein
MTKQDFLGFLADMNSVYQGMTKMVDDVTSGTAATKEPVLGLQVPQGATSLIHKLS